MGTLAASAKAKLYASECANRLFEAIIETHATDCIDLLRAYLPNEHFALRVNAAVTLIHLGDDAGRAVLAELEPYLQSCSKCLKRRYRQEALDRLH